MQIVTFLTESLSQTDLGNVVVQSLSRVRLCDPMDCSIPGFPVLHHILELPQLMSIETVMPSKHLILCRPLLPLPSIFPSIRAFSNQTALCIRWPKCWSFSFNISPPNEHSRLISFRIDWFDLLAAQHTLKSLLQRNSKTSILQHSIFFMIQLSHPYMTTRRSIALTIWTLVAKWCLCLLICSLGLS